MKKLLTFVFLTVTLIVVAENYNTIFNANIRNHKIENGDYNEEYRNVAKQMISQITTPVQDMTEYYFSSNIFPRLPLRSKLQQISSTSR